MASTGASYTAVCSRNRLRFIQHLCRASWADSRDVDEKPHTIIIAPGADAKNNAGSQRVLKYLLLGSGGRDLANATIDFADAELEDMLLAIEHDCVTIYAPPAVVSRLEPHLAAWRNRVDYSLKLADMDDADKTDTFKIRSFFAMIEPHQRVGLALTAGWSRSSKRPAAADAYDQMEVEEWPLVMAYALEDFNMGGFFTMQHNVVNVTPSLESIFSHVDAHYLKSNVLDQAVPNLFTQWNLVLDHLDAVRTPHRRLKQTEELVADAIVTNFEFGSMRLERMGEFFPPGHGARVLFGTRTSNQDAASDSTPALTAGPKGSPALHFTVEAEDPTTCVRVARTYFLRTTMEPRLDAKAGSYQQYADDDDDATTEGGAETKGEDDGAAAAAHLSWADLHAHDAGTKDAKYLRKVYEVVLAALKSACRALDGCSHEEAPQACLLAAFECFAPDEEDEDGEGDDKELEDEEEEEEDDELLPDDFSLGDNLTVSIDYTDARGRPLTPAEAGAASRRVLAYVKVALVNIPAADHHEDGTILGGIVAADTVVMHPRPSTQPTTVLTSQFPYRCAWLTSGVEEEAAQHLDRLVSASGTRSSVLGISRAIGEHMHHVGVLCDAASPSPTLEGTLQLYQTGFIVQGTRFGVIPVSVELHVLSTEVVPASKWTAALGMVTPDDAAWVETTAQDTTPAADVLVFHLSKDAPIACEYLGLVLPPGSVVRDTIFDALPGWHKLIVARNEAGKSLTHTGPVWSGSTVPAALHIGYRSFSNTTWSSTPAAKALVEACIQGDAFRHEPVKPEPVPEPESTSIPVVIISGTSGSGKSRVASSVASFSSNDFKWHLIQQPLTAGMTFNAKTLQDQLVSACSALQGNSTKPPRICLVAPNYADVVATAAVVTSVPGVHVAACVACVHAKHMYCDTRRTRWLPRLEEQFTSGWCTHVAVTGCEDASTEEIDVIRRLVKLANPAVSVLRLSGGLGRSVNLSSELANDIVRSTAFSSAHNTAMRNATCPGWHTAYDALLKAPSPTSSIADLATKVQQTEAPVSGVAALPSSVSCVSFAVPVVFQKRRLQTVLKLLVRLGSDPVARELDDPAADKSTLPCTWRCKGFVRCVGDDLTAAPTWVQVDAVPGVVRFGAVEPRQSVGDKQVGSLMAIGTNLDTTAVRNLLMRCRPRAMQALPLRTVASLTADELSLIRSTRLQDAVPEGWWFDGQSYMDHTGFKTQDHPLMSQFKEDYVAQCNAVLEAHNKVAAAQRAGAAAELEGKSTSAWWLIGSDEPGDVHDPKSWAYMGASDNDLDDVIAAAGPKPSKVAAITAAAAQVKRKPAARRASAAVMTTTTTPVMHTTYAVRRASATAIGAGAGAGAGVEESKGSDE